MSREALLHENERLQSQLAERDEQLAERDERVRELEQQLDALAKKLELTARERKLLEAKLARLLALRNRVPTLAPGQGILEFDEHSAATEPTDKPPHVDEAPDGEAPDDRTKRRDKGKGRKGGARKLDLSNLPIEHVHHQIPDEERVCPITGKRLIPVGEELEDEIGYQPGYLKRLVHHRTVYGLSEEDARERQAPKQTAPGPVRPIEGSVVGPTLLAWILVQKYVHHLPLYRQESIFERDGLRIPRKTMCDWVLAAAEVLGPIQQALRRQILETGVVQIDDTPVKCQGPKGQGIFEARLWTMTSPEAKGVVYDFTSGRSRDDVLGVLGDYEKGWLVGDGYGAYGAVARVRPEIVPTGCWAHVIRKFKDALGEAPLLGVEVVTQIAKLFEVEDDAKDESAAVRLKIRRERSAPIIDKLDDLLARWRDRYSESGAMGEACKYLENQREPLQRFLEDGRVPIHNNACEVSIRPIAVGRKNWLFAGSVRGGRAAATIYTLVECCKQAGVDPHPYLSDVLVRVATHPASRVAELLPARWKQWAGDSASAAVLEGDQAQINA